MNGVRSTFMRKGYLLTALAAAVLLAASSGTAYAQRVSIGFVNTSGEISEKAHLNPNSLEDPQRITVRVRGLAAGGQREDDIMASLGDGDGALTIAANKDVYLALVNSLGAFVNGAGAAAVGGFVVEAGTPYALSGAEVLEWFDHDDDLNLVVAQSEAGAPDDNWLSEMIELKLEVAGTASVGPDVYTLTVEESDVAPVAKFKQPSFTLSEQSERTVQLDVASGRPGKRVPPGAFLEAGDDGGSAEYQGVISVRVSNHGVVALPGDIPEAQRDSRQCPLSTSSLYNRKLFYISLAPVLTGGAVEWAASGTFSNTGVLQTLEATNIAALATGTGDGSTADFVIVGCGDGKGIADPRITLTILPSNLSEVRPLNGDITIGAPLAISTDSNEAAPTLSFSPTDVTIDEGGSTSTVLLAEGKNTSDVKMVKLSIEGDAMVSLMQDGEMLEEMNGHVYVDLGGNSSVRLTAMSHSDPDLMDGDMAFKAWKLMDDSAEGVDIGDDYWFRVDVVGSTAVPALPLVGQLLLALFLMAGGARLYRRRQG